MAQPERLDAGGATPLVGVQLVEALVNTRSLELGTDELDTPAAAASWLGEQQRLIGPGVRVTPAMHRRLLRLREGIRALLVAEQEPGAADAARDDLAALVRELPLVLDVAAAPRLVPLRIGTVDAALATVVAAVAEATTDGSWDRLKVCREPTCRWAYVDLSRNRSRTWCSMATCGNRAKARAFRRRG